MKMDKCYVRSARSGDAGRRDYIFVESLREARHWDSRESAQHDCDIFEASQIELRLLNDSRYFCSGFTVEELTPNDYVVSVVAPFGEMAPTAEKLGNGVGNG